MTDATGSILHVDLDAFYASVEQLKRPELQGKPVIVGGGVVTSASYEARAFGVRSGMPTGAAKKLCPRAVVVGGSFADYGEISDEVFRLCREVTPIVEQVSIDEAFLEVSGAHGHFGDSVQIAHHVRRVVRSSTRLTLSVGIARTKFLAKVASQVAKPDGVVAVPAEGELDFLHPLPVRYLWGVGAVTEERLAEMGLLTVRDVAGTSPAALRARLGAGAARHLHGLAWNLDPRSVETGRRARSVGAQSTFGRDVRSSDEYHSVLMRLCDRVGGRLRAKKRVGRTVTVRVRFSDFETVTRSSTLRAGVSSTSALHAVAVELMGRGLEAAAGRGVRLLGVAVSKLAHSPHLQLELPYWDPMEGTGVTRPGSALMLDRDRMDGAIDEIRSRFGRSAIGPASSLSDRQHRGDGYHLGDLMIRWEQGGVDGVSSPR